MSATTKTAAELTAGDVIESVHGPSKVIAARTVDGNVEIAVAIVASGIEWGDVYPASHTFKIVDAA